jgi:hypothetical protein
MMKPLRKIHLQAWTTLALLLPAGIVFAWLAIPNIEPVRLLQAPAIEPLSNVKSSVDREQFTVNLRTDQQNQRWQLEWKNKLPLTIPSGVIYKASPKPSEGGALKPLIVEGSELIGRIEARGEYLFSISVDTNIENEITLILYDFIHEKIIDSLKLHL